MALTCERCVDLFEGYVEGLDAGLRAEVDAHLLGCGACREVLAGYRRIPGLLRRVTDLPMPAAAQARLRRRLARRWR